MNWVPFLVAACSGSDPAPADAVVPDPPVPTGSTAEDTSSPTTGLLPLGTECDETIVVPTTALGSADPAPLPDPHSNVFGPSPEPYVVRYSWPSNDPSDSASFLWRTDVGTLATTLEYGTGGTLTGRVEGASFLFDGDPGDYRIHEVKLCGDLQPDTTYQYRVGGDGHFSQMYSFTTPKAPGTFDSFRIGVVGDTRGSYEEWSQIFAAMESHDPDFYLFTGDAVGYGGNQEEWDNWFRATGDVLAHKALIPAHGNHEGLATNYFAQVSLPGNEQWFTIKYGNVHLVVLNDTAAGATSVSDQATYLDRSFAEAVPGYRGVAAHHQGLYASCVVHRSNEILRDAWVPKYDLYGMQLVFNGHNHIYERSVPIRGGVEVPAADGAIYVTTGGGGAPLYRTWDEEEWFLGAAEAIEHYVIADFGPDEVQVVARDYAGNVIDSFIR
jgi:hypothetical protein